MKSWNQKELQCGLDRFTWQVGAESCHIEIYLTYVLRTYLTYFNIRFNHFHVTFDIWNTFVSPVCTSVTFIALTLWTSPNSLMWHLGCCLEALWPQSKTTGAGKKAMSGLTGHNCSVWKPLRSSASTTAFQCLLRPFPFSALGNAAVFLWSPQLSLFRKV